MRRFARCARLLLLIGQCCRRGGTALAFNLTTGRSQLSSRPACRDFATLATILCGWRPAFERNRCDGRSDRAYPAIHDFAVELSELTDLPKIVLCRILDPLSLDAKQVRHVLALRDAPERVAVPSRPMRNELADLGVPFADSLSHGLALLAEPTGHL